MVNELHASFVSAELPGPLARKSTFFSAAIPATATATAELVPPTSIEMCWLSIHSRALATAISGLF